MPEDNEEQFMQRRLLLASVISAVAVMAYLYGASWLSPKKAPVPVEPAAVEQPAAPAPSTPAVSSEAAGTPAAAAHETKPAAETPAPAEPAVAAESEQEVVLESDTYRVTFSNRGAVVKSWILKDYIDANGKPLELVHSVGAQKYGYPFKLILPGGEDLKELNNALFAITDGPGPRTAPATIAFEYNNGGLSARKSFEFEPNGYLLKLQSEVRQNGELRPHLIAWPGGFGDTAQTNDNRHSQTFYYDQASGKPKRNKATDAEPARIINTGSYSFNGVDDLYFTAVFMPQKPQVLTLETWAIKIIPDGVVVAEDADEATRLKAEQVFVAVASGGADQNDFQLYIGPKSIPILSSINPELRQIVDFGWLSFVSVPMFYMLLWTHEHIASNWGWAIVVVTIMINFVLFPLKWKSTRSMKKMQALQPMIKQINEKYKGLSMRDPKKAQQNEEMMALYKKYGVNPMGGCLPMVLQFPFFIGFYYVLTSAIEMRHAEWLWVSDLSRPETLAIRVLPIAMILSQFWQQSMTPQPSVDPAQARMMKFMPLLFGFFLYGFQSGLVLYWLTMNLVGVAQQYLLNRLATEPLEIEQPRRSKKKK